MNDILKYFAKSLSLSTLSLKKKGILIEKPWALIDDDGEIQKLIFKRDKELILSKNGKVTIGSWDYFPDAKALLIDRVEDKILLKEQFIDSNVLILKKDGTENDFFALANENTLPDYNIPRYLNSLKCKEFYIEERKLLNGKILQIYYGKSTRFPWDYLGLSIEQIDPNYNAIELSDGAYMTENKKLTFYVRNKRVNLVRRNVLKELIDGSTFEIENGNRENVITNINLKVTENGRPIPTSRLIDKHNVIYEIRESVIAEMYFINNYELKDGLKIRIEQKDDAKIRKGDKIVESTPVYPLPDGKYSIKGSFKKIKVINNVIS